LRLWVINRTGVKKLLAKRIITERQIVQIEKTGTWFRHLDTKKEYILLPYKTPSMGCPG
jgi:hypothetical protein